MLKKILSRKIKKIFTMKTLFVLLDLIFVFAVMFMIIFVNADEILKVILFVSTFLVYKVFESLLLEIAKEKQNPIRINRRFTHKNDETGAIEVKKEDFQQAILRLYEFENKIEL